LPFSFFQKNYFFVARASGVAANQLGNAWMPSEDDSWIRKINSLDALTFAEAINSIEDRIAGFIGKRVNNEADAQDILQAVFIGVMKWIRSKQEPDRPIKSRSHFINTAFAAAHCRIIDWQRRKGRSKVVRGLDLQFLIDESTTENDSEIEAAIFRMNEAIGKLLEIDQEIIQLVQDEKTQIEIAKQLGITRTAVNSKWQRAKETLRRAIKRDE